MTLPPYPCLGVPPDGFCPQTPTYSARECTSGAAWWGSQYTGKPWPTGWGNAMNWPTRARMAGLTVDTTYANNAIMCLGPNVNGAGPVGHVAYTIGPALRSHAEVWEMDFRIRYGFDHRPALITGCEYIHLTPKPVPPAPDPPTTKGVPKMFVWYRANGSIQLCNMVSCTSFGDGADVTLYLDAGFPAIHETACTIAWAAKINGLPQR